DRGALAMKDRAQGLQKIAATDDTEQLAPGTTIGMAVGAEIAPADPAAIGTIRVRAEVHRGVELAAAPPRGDHARGRSGGGLWARVSGVLTGVTVRFGGEACKRFGGTVALWRWGWECRRTRGGVAWPQDMEHDTQPHQGDQH